MIYTNQYFSTKNNNIITWQLKIHSVVEVKLSELLQVIPIAVAMLCVFEGMPVRVCSCLIFCPVFPQQF